ncbi:MAG: DUF1579 domain-containing protein [Verrucomicrobiales bacterium]
MKKTMIAWFAVALLSGATLLEAQELPKMPPPVKEHAWLQQFAGEWESDVEIFMEPGKPPMKAHGIENARMIGGFWVVADGKGEMMGMPFIHQLTLGYDPEQKKYVGTWIDSMSSYLWKYQGSVDASGKKLTLETEGPCPMAPGKLSKFKEITEFKSNDHKVFKSEMLGDDGKWRTVVTVDSRRKK